MSEKEIAEVFNRPLGTIKWQLYAARKHLVEILSPVLDYKMFEKPMEKQIKTVKAEGE